MRVLQVINCFTRGGGAEKFVYDLSVSLSQIDNVEVTILSIAKPDDSEFIESIKPYVKDVIVLSEKLKSLSVIRKLVKVIDSNFDVVHVHLFPSLYYLALVKIFAKSSFKLFYTEHSTQNRRRNHFFYKPIERFVYRKYDKIISISSQVNNNLVQHLSRLESVIINNGVNLLQISEIPIFDIKEYLDVPKDSVIVTMVARFVKGKDYITLFESLKHLPINVHIVCVGDGPLINQNKEFVDKLSYNDRVHFLGLRKNVLSIMKGSDIIVLSSEHEGFSISMLEAMACRKPFIASDVEGLCDTAGGVAVFFPYQDSEKISEKILKLINDKAYYNLIADRCFNFSMKYDINVVSNKYLDVYCSN